MGIPDFELPETASIQVALRTMAAQPKQQLTSQSLIAVKNPKVSKPGVVKKPAVVESVVTEKMITDADISDPVIEAAIISDITTAKDHITELPTQAQQETVKPEQASNKDIALQDEGLMQADHLADVDQEPVKEVVPSADVSMQASQIIVHEAKYRKRTQLVYPRRAQELGQQGVVTLHAKVMPTGLPDEIKVVESSGYRLLDSAALAAVKRWEFKPTMVNGDAIVSWVRVPVNFVIQ